MNFFAKIISSKFTPIFISLVVLLSALFWFQTTYSEKNSFKNPFNIDKKAYYKLTYPEKVFLNQPFKMIVSLNTKGSTVNAVGLNISYESEKIKVTNIDTTQSFCQFYPEKKFNDNSGTITIACGSPSPGFSGENDVLVVEFKPVKMGTTTVSIDDQSKILSSDGKGTNILSEYPRANINIINSL